MWLIERDGSTLGWGHSHQRDDAMTDAWDLVTDFTSPDEFESIEISSYAEYVGPSTSSSP
jgi:hypothetical protein